MNCRTLGSLRGKLGFRDWNGGLGGGRSLEAEWTVIVEVFPPIYTFERRLKSISIDFIVPLNLFPPLLISFNANLIPTVKVEWKLCQLGAIEYFDLSQTWEGECILTYALQFW
ncbi:Uncharacterized protein TCM_027220 [Theobroma cacao]|uniref:Uncharacterized protein n=1 Tax=Theobroma cacao TaxID=3641 RepID=A0A061G7M0_THECC|nr:Uncharacterized protein TCM_027220 [Theobroma cacao]